MDHALRVRLPRSAAQLALLLGAWLACTHAAAQLPLAPDGLRGAREVGSAVPLRSGPRLVLGAGYAYTESVLDGSDRHQRLLGEVAAAYAPYALLQLSLDLSARFDTHTSDLAGRDRGGAFATDLRTRHALALTPTLAVAGQTRWRFPPAESVGRGFRAVSPELGVLGSFTPRRYELSLGLGYRFERTDKAFSAPAALSAADRLGAALSRYDALLLGALFALPLGPVTSSLSFRWDVAVGSGTPRATTWPMRLALAAQTRLGERYLPGVEVGVRTSAAPRLESGARIEPRLWIALQLGILLERRAAPTPTSKIERPTPVASVPRETRLTIHVSDPAGVPVDGARVRFVIGEDAREGESDRAGDTILEVPTERAARLRVERAGYQPHEVEAAPIAGPQTLAVVLRRALPEGQIKGKVRSLRGGHPVQAQITVAPLGLTFETSPTGDFEVNVPPGGYTLAISAPGYERQERPAQVEHLGVTILVVDLRRALR